MDDHAAAISLHFTSYNFLGRTRSSASRPSVGGAKITPAMAAGVSDHVWSVWKIAALQDPLKGQNAN